MSDEDHDGERLLNKTRDAYANFCILPSEHALIAVVLWTVAAHLVAEFHFAPRLIVRSAEKRSGKTRLLEVTAELVPEKPLRMANATLAYVFRALAGDPPPTVLFDEADTAFGSKKVAEQNEDLRALFNAGFQRGTPIGRTVGPQHTPTEFETFAFAALAGIGRMPDTIEDRGVVVQMRRRKQSEKVAPYRARRDAPDLHDIRECIAEWAEQIRDKIRFHEPENLGVDDRAADVWEPLIAVADMAKGHWPASARAAAKAMVTQAAEDDAADSTNMRLLSDIRDVFAGMPGVSFLKSDALCTKLHEITDSPWSQFELNSSKLGHRLREYQIKTNFRDRTKSERGYRLVDFQDAFERYLPNADEGDKDDSESDSQADTRPQVSAPVRMGDDQQKRADGFVSADTLKASAEIKASAETCRSNGMRTPADGCGHLTVRKPLCPTCHRAPARTDTGQCDLCTAKTNANNGGTAA